MAEKKAEKKEKKGNSKAKAEVVKADVNKNSKAKASEKKEVKKEIIKEVKVVAEDKESAAKTKAKPEAKPEKRVEKRINTNRHKSRKKHPRRKRENPDGLDKRIVSIRRVARTYKGGKRLRLSVLVVVGDKKGKVGVGLGKGIDVRSAEEKAYNAAKKNMVKVALKGRTIPHAITYKKGAALIFIKPAAPGTGVIAGSSLRAVLELVGVKDILTKVLGSSNNISNAYAAVEALTQLKSTKNKDVK